MQCVVVVSVRAPLRRLHRRRRLLSRIRFLCAVLWFVVVGLHRRRLQLLPVRRSARGQGGDQRRGAAAMCVGRQLWRMFTGGFLLWLSLFVRSSFTVVCLPLSFACAR